MPLISVSSKDLPLKGFYLLSILCNIWREQGIETHVAREFHPQADLCILHHDRTFVTPADVPAGPVGVRVLNGQVHDISKRRYSVLALTPESDWSGPVIIKTNLNHSGVPERPDGGRTLTAELRHLLARGSWRLARTLPAGNYPILDVIGAVPDWVWRHPGLIVEKFLPERQDGHYCLRGWLFFGEESYGYRLFASNPLVKLKSISRYEYIETQPPESIRRLRDQMAFDFGKFDYVLHDGEAILLDANKTPTLARDSRSERVMRLARAVQSCLP